MSRTYDSVIKEIIEKARKEGCPHVGVNPPEDFQCIDCEDNAAECNCLSCMGVFCNKCGKDLSLDCEEIRMAYEYIKEKENNESQEPKIAGLKCFRCGKPIKEKVIPLEQPSTDKWDDDWGIEVLSEGRIITICLECYRKIMR